MATRQGTAEIVSTLEELKTLAPRWDRLASAFPTPLLTHDWFVSAALTLHSGDRISTFVRRSGDDIVALAPFVERRRYGLKSLETIGFSTLLEPTGLLYAQPSDLRDMLEQIAACGTPVSFDRVGDPLLVAELSAIADGTAAELKQSLATSPWIPIRGSWDTYYASLTSKWRSTHRRALKKAEAAGKLAFEYHAPGPEAFPAMMERLADVEARGWKGRLGTALRTDPPLRAFFETYGAAAARRGTARFAFMNIGGETVAGQFSVDHARRRWLLKIGYDENYAHCSPGILLMHGALQQAFDSRLEAFEFLGSNEQWLRVWNHNEHKYYSRVIDRAQTHRLFRSAMALSGRVKRRIRREIARTLKRN